MKDRYQSISGGNILSLDRKRYCPVILPPVAVFMFSLTLSLVKIIPDW